MTKHFERVSDDTLRSFIGRSGRYPLPIPLLEKVASELIEARKSYEFVQHKPDCHRLLCEYPPEMHDCVCTCGHDQLAEFIRDAK